MLHSGKRKGKEDKKNGEEWNYMGQLVLENSDTAYVWATSEAYSANRSEGTQVVR